MELKEKHINIGLNYGGLGDAIARAPAVLEMLNEYPHLEVTLFVFPSAIPLYYEWFAKHPRVRDIKPLAEFDQLPEGELILNFDHSWYFQLGMHLTDHAYLTLTQSIPRKKLPYLPLGSGAYNTPATSKLVCITPNFTAMSRSLPPNIWADIIHGIKAFGLVPVILGSTKSEFGGASYVESQPGCIDLRDKTTLLEAVNWIEKSIAVIGIDNGLIHLAACTKTPIIVAYSTQIPENRLPPERNTGVIKYITPPSYVCQGCESWLRFEPNHNFKGCYKKTFDCVQSFTALDFLTPLRELINDLG